MSDNNVVDLTRSVAFAVTDKSLITLDLAAIDKAQAERRAKEEAAKPPVDESQEWRQELAELERQLSGYRTPEAWRTYSNEQEAIHNANIKTITDEIEAVKALLTIEGLDMCRWRRAGQAPPALSMDDRGRTNGQICGCSACMFHGQIARLEDSLIEAKYAQRKSIKTYGAAIKNAEELSKLVPRANELKARAKAIDDARKSIKGITNTPLQPEPIGGGDQFRQSTTRGGFHFTKD
jgi:hypothetical protein